MSAPRTAYVTGGSAFIGGRLIRRLVEDGWAVRALARSDSSAARVQAARAEPVTADLDDVTAMRAGAEGCSTAFHAAAVVREWGPWEEFEHGNVGGRRTPSRPAARPGSAASCTSAPRRP